MKFFSVLFAFAALSGIYCSDDLDDASAGVEVGESKFLLFETSFFSLALFANSYSRLKFSSEKSQSYGKYNGLFFLWYRESNFFGSLDVNYQNYQDVDTNLSMECEEHEEYSECSGDRTCQKTCENMDQWETMTCARTKVCIHGCICKDSYVRDDSSGACVEENSCLRMKH